MKKNTAVGVVLAIAALSIVSCGGGNEGDSQSPIAPPLNPLEQLGFLVEAEFDEASADSSDSSYYLSSNNSSLLSGETVGSGSLSNTELIRPLRFVVSESDEGLVVNAVYLVRNDDNHDLIISARNLGQNRLCRIVIAEVVGFDIEGAQVGQSTLVPTSNGMLPIQGSFGEYLFADDSFTSTCLTSGESAYFFMPIIDQQVEDLAAVNGGLHGELRSQR